MEYAVYIVLPTAIVIAAFYFWCTYRYIREPAHGREESHMSEIRRIQGYISENPEIQVGEQH